MHCAGYLIFTTSQAKTRGLAISQSWLVAAGGGISANHMVVLHRRPLTPGPASSWGGLYRWYPQFQGHSTWGIPSPHHQRCINWSCHQPAPPNTFWWRIGSRRVGISVSEALLVVDGSV